jgi:hypothetical protein
MWEVYYQSMDNTKNRKRKRKLSQKMKKSLGERHTQTHGSLIETFQQLQMSFSIIRE